MKLFKGLQSASKVEVYLHGGLGNQLFGWAAGYSLATRFESKLVINVSQLKSRTLSLPQHALEGLEISKSCSAYYSSHFELVRHLYRNTPFQRKYFERKFLFEERFHKISRPVKLYGYFQSINYFEPQIQEIVAKLSNPETLSTQFLKLEQIIPRRFISIHFRRGDYVTHADFHPLIGKEYYLKAIDFLSQKSCIWPLVVFTDDDQLAREAFPGVQIVSQTELDSPFENLLLMSRGEAIIGANSTFSLWASILMQQPSHFKIFPEKWFGPAMLQNGNPVPPGYTLF